MSSVRRKLYNFGQGGHIFGTAFSSKSPLFKKARKKLQVPSEGLLITPHFDQLLYTGVHQHGKKYPSVTLSRMYRNLGIDYRRS